MLSEVPDFRKPRGKRHPLPAVLGLSVIALMCGYRSYSAIAEYRRTSDRKLLEALGFTHAKTPCASTLHHLLKNIDVAALEKVLSQWAKAVLAEIPGEDTTAVALDGKTLIRKYQARRNDFTPALCRLSSTRYHARTATRGYQNQ